MKARSGFESAGLVSPRVVILALVVLGAILRLIRYAWNAPLWWNEAFVAVNFLDRGYLDLLKPLDYGQVCPLGFLWVEKAVVDLIGFRETALRLAPLVSGVSALLVFARLADRVQTGRAAVFSVAILAMAYHPIRLSAEAKPYASDLLAASVVLQLAMGGNEESKPRSFRGLFWLMALTPLLILVSHPVVFVLVGVWLVLAGRVAHSDDGEWKTRAVWVGLGGVISASFGASYLLYTRGQAAATLEGMRDYWAGAFLPVSEPGRLVPWLFEAHAGRMFAYPVGGAHAGSLVTLILVVLGVWRLVRNRQRERLAMLLVPFGLTLAASAIERHPYGGHPRVAQHLAPAIVLLAGSGLDVVIGRFRCVRRQARLAVVGVLVLVAMGVVPMVLEAGHPARSETERRARAFARRYWSSEVCRGAVVSLRGRVPGAPWVSSDPDVALMLCDLKIVNPEARVGRLSELEPGEGRVRYLLDYASRLESPRIPEWLDGPGVLCKETTIDLGRGPRRVLMREVPGRVSVTGSGSALR